MSIQIKVTLTKQMQQYVDSCVADGRYLTADEYIRDLIRHDMEDESPAEGLLHHLMEQAMMEPGILNDSDEDEGPQRIHRLPRRQ